MEEWGGHGRFKNSGGKSNLLSKTQKLCSNEMLSCMSIKNLIQFIDIHLLSFTVKLKLFV